MATNFANITADTLHAHAVRQISKFLASSAKLERTGLTADERETMERAATALDTILTWQTPAEAAHA